MEQHEGYGAVALDQRVDRLERALERLAEAQARTEERMVGLMEAQARTVEWLRRLTDDVAALKGDNLERRYRENAVAYFQRILVGARLVTREEVGRIAAEAEGRGVLSPPEHEELLWADVVVLGRVREDVQRAAERPRLLRRTVGMPQGVGGTTGPGAPGGSRPVAIQRLSPCSLRTAPIGTAPPVVAGSVGR